MALHLTEIEAMNAETTDQAGLASELNVTERLIRQMITERILPEPRDGMFDRQRCWHRYELFRHGTAEDWRRFFDQMSARAEDVARMHERATKPKASDAQVTAASRAHQDLLSDMRFIIACRSSSAAERDRHFHILDNEDKRAMGALMAAVLTNRKQALVDDDG
jgi:hypothetical protein